MKLENISLGKSLSFTYNPSDDHQYFGQPGRLELFTDYHHKLFHATLSYFCDWELYPEYSFKPNSSDMKPTGPRLHYHGIIKFTDLDPFLELFYTKLSRRGHFDIDTIEEGYDWIGKYCKKSCKIMQPMFKKRKLPYKLSSTRLSNTIVRRSGARGHPGPPGEEDDDDLLDRL